MEKSMEANLMSPGPPKIEYVMPVVVYITLNWEYTIFGRGVCHVRLQGLACSVRILDDTGLRA